MDVPRWNREPPNVRIDFVEPPENVRIHLARTEEELRSAFSLTYRTYVSQGAMRPNPLGLRILPQHAITGSAVAVAFDDDRIIGTMSMLCDSAIGLPMDSAFDLSPFRQGRGVVELGAFAVD